MCVSPYCMNTIQYEKLKTIYVIKNLIKTVEIDSAKRDSPGKSI
jgi:hypothetical protein